MIDAIRHDMIRLYPSSDGRVFEEFMHSELIPYVETAYGHSNRNSLAVLEQQLLLRVLDDERNYLWITYWSGRTDHLKKWPFDAAARVSWRRDAEQPQVFTMLKQFGRRRFAALLQSIAADESGLAGLGLAGGACAG